MNKKALFAVCAATIALTSSAKAFEAVTLDSSGTFDLDFGNNASISGVTANIQYTFSSLSQNNNTVYTFNYKVNNTSTTDSLITAFGFNTDSNFSSSSNVNGIFSDLLANAHTPGGGSVDFCASVKANNNCSGVGSSGVDDGDQSSGSFKLTFSGKLASINLDNFYVRYQSIGPNDFSTTGAPIPEPGEWAMMLAGLGVIGFMAQRRRKNAALVA